MIFDLHYFLPSFLPFFLSFFLPPPHSPPNLHQSIITNKLSPTNYPTTNIHQPNVTNQSPTNCYQPNIAINYDFLANYLLQRVGCTPWRWLPQLGPPLFRCDLRARRSKIQWFTGMCRCRRSAICKGHLVFWCSNIDFSLSALFYFEMQFLWQVLPFGHNNNHWGIQIS